MTFIPAIFTTRSVPPGLRSAGAGAGYVAINLVNNAVNGTGAAVLTALLVAVPTVYYGAYNALEMWRYHMGDGESRSARKHQIFTRAALLATALTAGIGTFSAALNSDVIYKFKNRDAIENLRPGDSFATCPGNDHCSPLPAETDRCTPETPRLIGMGRDQNGRLYAMCMNG